MEINTNYCGILTENEQLKVNELLNVIDKSPVLFNFETVNKNMDFYVLNAGIEITKSFTLKALKIFNISYEIKKIDFQNNGILVVVKLTSKENPRIIEGVGACSFGEISGKRLHHDCTGIAETRAIKRAIEMYLGVKLIDNLIVSLFKGYCFLENKLNIFRRNTHLPLPDENKVMANNIYIELLQAVKEKTMKIETAEQWWKMVEENIFNKEQLQEISESVYSTLNPGE